MSTRPTPKHSEMVGTASTSHARVGLFDDPRWEDRFDILIRLTQRTQLIKQLTGSDMRLQRIKAAINKRLTLMGVEIHRPRGGGQTPIAKGFLAKVADRYDAAYLLGLHFGANGSGSLAAFETNLGSSLDKRIETYLRYRSDLYDRPEDARISFETYCVLVDGISQRFVTVHTCKECSSSYPWPSAALSRHSCPMCMVHQTDIKASKQKIESLLAKRLGKPIANAS